MKKNIFNKTALIMAMMALGLAALEVRADDETTQTRDVDVFDAILIEGALTLNVTVGGERSVTVTTDGDRIDDIETGVDSGTLFISQNSRYRWNDDEITIDVIVPALNRLIVEGAADATIEGISSEHFAVKIDGAVDLTLVGECEEAEYIINGAGDIDAREFICQDVDIEINGAGDADIFASEKIVATVNGVGDVSVYGNPNNIRPSINGLGSFDIK